MSRIVQIVACAGNWVVEYADGVLAPVAVWALIENEELKDAEEDQDIRYVVPIIQVDGGVMADPDCKAMTEFHGVVASYHPHPTGPVTVAETDETRAPADAVLGDSVGATR